MRNQLIGGVLAIAVLAGWPAMAGAQDAKAAEILAATRKAVGDKKLDAMKTLSVNAKMLRNMSTFQSETAVEMLLEMPDKYVRSDTFSLGGGMSAPMTSGFNGDKAITPGNMRIAPGGAMVMTMGTAPAGHTGPDEKPTPEQVERVNKSSLRNYRQEISRLMLGWFGAAHPALNATYTYVGEAESPDGKAYVIDVKDADDFAARLFIDQNSKLPLMVTFQGRAPRVMTAGGPGVARVAGDVQKQVEQMKASATPAPMVEMSLFFEDWKEVDGINFPHVMRRASEGKTTEEWTINKVKVNPKIDPKKFETK